jgi:hypothetical protein
VFYDFKMKFKKKINIYFNVNAEKRLVLKLIFFRTIFLAYFTMLGPNDEYGMLMRKKKTQVRC